MPLPSRPTTPNPSRPAALNSSRPAALTEYVLEHAPRPGGRTALIDAHTAATTPYDTLLTAIAQVRAGLAASGVTRGTVVALQIPNGAALPVLLHAALSLGAVVTPIGVLSSPQETRRQLAHSGAAVHVTCPPGRPAHGPGRPGPRTFTLASAGADHDFAGLRHDTPPAAGPPPCTGRGGDIALLPYSSGTTGHPKGVMLSHASLVAGMAAMAAAHRVGADETVLATGPLTHVYALQCALHPALRAGARAVTMRRFELTLMLRLIEEYGVTRIYLTPAVLAALARAPEAAARHDLSTLRLVVSASAPLGAGLHHRAEALLRAPVVEGFGMTETGNCTHIVPDACPPAVGTVGRALPRTECRIVALGTGSPLGPGSVGELQVRGPQTMTGYLADPGATAAALGPDGWLRTGDVGLLDGDGNLRLTGRVKEMIKYKGYQVAPAELEDVLRGHPDVADAAVVGVPDPVAGEVPKAYVVLRRPTSLEAVRQHVAEQVAPYKKIRQIESVERIPRSATGKILRHRLTAAPPAGAAPGTAPAGVRSRQEGGLPRPAR
ncbi:AMP-binding protein [Streptomyces griseocarneus]|uniref:AMP-binding protein n=1 Tax=Streptomyces griseocarneus TaxID=51201 RepID=UPI00167DD447|nr:AMP-binding protein [Streptomyces griseocarneus]MBZ6476330.1 AMP-binding protein [Streptomyces griseocarneus]GHG78148.1 AMP-dependent synthetase [Streptomyces griseocarneus]